MHESNLSRSLLSVYSPNEVGLAVLGWPVSHSISPFLHNAALEKLSLVDSNFKNWRYEKLQVPAEDLSSILPQMAKCGYRGMNLTIPHKVRVLPYLSEVTKEAQVMGAVNTLVKVKDGWMGYNTDGYGLQRALESTFKIYLREHVVLILGAGGAARAAAAKCLSVGCEQVWISNRSRDRMNALVSDLSEEFPSSSLKSFQIDRFPNSLYDVSNLIIINATSLGLHESDASPLNFPFSNFNVEAKAFDMIYNPAETEFLRKAKEAGMEFSNGLSMLVFQALRSLEIWTGREISEKAMFEGARKGMNSNLN